MYTVLIPAAGSGQRMGAGYNKLFLTLGDKPIFIRTLEVFERDALCAGIILAVKQEEREQIISLLTQYNITKVKKIVDGGSERQHSVAACLAACEDVEIVLVHDAARPFIRKSVIGNLVVAATKHGAAIAGVKAKDTMKLAVSGVVEKTIERDALWIVQTPQAFRYELLKEAADKAAADDFLGTDEAMLVERLAYPVHIVESSYDNVKMTTPEDLAFGEIILTQQQSEE